MHVKYTVLLIYVNSKYSPAPPPKTKRQNKNTLMDSNFKLSKPDSNPTACIQYLTKIIENALSNNDNDNNNNDDDDNPNYNNDDNNNNNNDLLFHKH